MKSDLWTGPQISLDFEQKLSILPVYMLCIIYLDFALDPNDPDEPHAEFIRSISPIWIRSLLKYGYIPHQEIMNLLGSLYILFLNITTQSGLHHHTQ